MEVGDRIQKLDALPAHAQFGDAFAECLGDEPVLIHLHVADLGLIRPEHPDRPDIAGRFGQNHVVRVDEQFRDEIEGLLRSGGHHHVIDAAPDSLQRHHRENLLAQGGCALARAVLEGLWASLRHHSIERCADQIGGKRGHEGHTSRERHDLGPGSHREQGAHFGGAEACGAGRVLVVPGVEVGARAGRGAVMRAHELIRRSVDGASGRRDARATSVACGDGTPVKTTTLFHVKQKRPATLTWQAVAGCASQARYSASSCSSAPLGLAPMTVLTTSPPRNTFIAGIDVI